MTKELWLNLPVKDVSRSKAFFTAIGFRFNEQHSTPQSACMLVGQKPTVVMLFEESLFSGFSQHPVANTSVASEILVSFDAESRDEVDMLAQAAAANGGNLFAPPGDNQGWMYGCAFTDPDGHRWNILYMDKDKMPKASV